MSFSSDVKDELARLDTRRRHCVLAELAAIVGMIGRIQISNGNTSIYIHTENVTLARKCFTLIKKAFNISTEIEIGTSYQIRVTADEDTKRILQALKVVDEDGMIDTNRLVNPLLIQNECCRRAFIRGAFLAAGSMSDPEKFYHFEIVCESPQKAEQLMEMINSFGIDSKIVERKNHFVVYIKEGTQIVDLLNIMEAHVSLMQMENVRILKDMRNNVNRQVNCETANLNKTVGAAVRQVEDIHLIRTRGGMERLPDNLKEIAQARMDHPDASLKELGEMLDPPIGKSGVNHRLRKISEIADSMRG